MSEIKISAETGLPELPDDQRWVVSRGEVPREVYVRLERTTRETVERDWTRVDGWHPNPAAASPEQVFGRSDSFWAWDIPFTERTTDKTYTDVERRVDYEAYGFMFFRTREKHYMRATEHVEETLVLSFAEHIPASAEAILEAAIGILEMQEEDDLGRKAQAELCGIYPPKRLESK